MARLRFYIICGLILCSFSSCIKKEKLSESEELYWLAVMEDVYVAKAASERYFGFEKDSMYSHHLNEVYAKHKIDSQVLDSFMNFMIDNSIMQPFYGKLMERIDSRSDSLELKKPSQEK